MKKIFALLLVIATAFLLVACEEPTEEATIVNIDIVAEPRKLEYEVGESHDYTGIRVDAIYSNDTFQTLAATEYTFSGFTTETVGEKTITVTHTLSSKTDTFKINVIAAQVVDTLVVSKQPTKTEFLLNQDLDLAGLELTAVYDRGRVETVLHNAAGVTVTGYNKAVEGPQVVTVAFGGKTVTVNINVTDPTKLTVVGIEIAVNPNKTVYGLNQELNISGMVVNKVYDNGSKEIIDHEELVISLFDSSEVTNQASAIVTFETFTAVFNYSVLENVVQGVTNTTIKVGNTAATSGAFAAVGIPFNQGMLAAFKKFNDANGVNGRKIEFVTYDDGFVAETGVNLTKRLVEEDKIFALVGHFGTPTVGATVQYIQDTGIPMVYAATGINALYFQESPKNPVMAVQPIYMTDGRVMAARLLKESVYGTGNQPFPANGKVGVLHTTSDDGISIKAGIELEAAFHNKTADFIYKPFSATDVANLSTAINELLDAGVSAIIIAANQAPMKAAVNALQDAGSIVPVFTSYVNSNADSVDATITYGFSMYANAWLDIVDVNGTLGLSDAYWTFYTDMVAAGYDDNATNAYAMAGYIAASIFLEGIVRVGEDLLTWETYITAMENGAINVPMGGTIDFSGGQRWGIDSMALLKLSQAGELPAWVKVADIETLANIQAK